MTILKFSKDFPFGFDPPNFFYQSNFLLFCKNYNEKMEKHKRSFSNRITNKSRVEFNGASAFYAVYISSEIISTTYNDL